MKVSKFGLKTRKTRGNTEDLYQEILFQSKQLKRNVQGIYSLGPILTISRNKLVEFLRSKLNSYDCVEVSLPVMQPKQIWTASGRWEKYTENGTMFTLKGKNGEYCIAPTGEEIMFEYVNDIIESYKDMPVTFYQIGTKYRDELRVRGGLLRSKEFLMKDAYSFHATSEDMEREYERLKQCYIEFFAGVGLKAIPVLANSADMGGKVSNEFMVESKIGEDTILIDDENNLAFNIEVEEDESLQAYYKEKYPYINFDKMRRVKGIEVGHIFQLNQFYSKSMNGTFVDRDGTTKHYYMGCYGIGVNRTLGAILEHFSDEKGLRFPKIIRPFDVGIVNLNDEELNKYSEELHNKLIGEGLNVMWDDRNLSLGVKIKDLNLIGVRNLIIIGNNFKSSKMLELELDGEKLSLNEAEIIDKLKNI